ncbi:hypothetical protein BSL78_01918 [Apostichopus japonicus]|uniref:Uncharacterized protein n=1 Tax=Stichopus japonicus TaxID=307972 RepID=A0A2G8LLH5_STIJA|nr:hypothetical protein BSL78_01918 [Apostichopus japonicus]
MGRLRLALLIFVSMVVITCLVQARPSRSKHHCNSRQGKYTANCIRTNARRNKNRRKGRSIVEESLESSFADNILAKLHNNTNGVLNEKDVHVAPYTSEEIQDFSKMLAESDIDGDNWGYLKGT